MKTTIDNDKDMDKIEKADKKSKRGFIKISDERNFIRLAAKDIRTEFTHVLNMGDDRFIQHVCLGGIDGDGYAPDDCPDCGQAKKHWDKRKEIMNDPKFSKSRRLKSDADIEYKAGMALQTQKRSMMKAVYGEAVKEKIDGKIKFVPEWEEEVKYLPITSAQLTKLKVTIFEDYDFMKSTDDLINRNLCFEKKKKKNKKGGKYTEVEIKPSKKKSNAPEISNDLDDLDLDTIFREVTEKEMKKELNEYLELQGEDIEEDEDDLEEENEKEEKKKKKEEKDEELDDLEDDLEDDEEEEDKNKKKKKDKKKDEEGELEDDEDDDKEEDDF